MIPRHCGVPMMYQVRTDDFWCPKCGDMILSRDIPIPEPEPASEAITEPSDVGTP